MINKKIAVIIVLVVMIASSLFINISNTNNVIKPLKSLPNKNTTKYVSDASGQGISDYWNTSDIVQTGVVYSNYTITQHILGYLEDTLSLNNVFILINKNIVINKPLIVNITVKTSLEASTFYLYANYSNNKTSILITSISVSNTAAYVVINGYYNNSPSSNFTGFYITSSALGNINEVITNNVLTNHNVSYASLGSTGTGNGISYYTAIFSKSNIITPIFNSK